MLNLVNDLFNLVVLEILQLEWPVLIMLNVFTFLINGITVHLVYSTVICLFVFYLKSYRESVSEQLSKAVPKAILINTLTPSVLLTVFKKHWLILISAMVSHILN